MRSTAKTPEEYIETLDESRRNDITVLHELIRSTAPQLKPSMQAGMLGYGTYHYTYASGREGDWPIIGLAAQKNYISLYVNVGVAAKHRTALPKADIGKSCIRFKRLRDVDVEVLKQVIQEAAAAGKM